MSEPQPIKTHYEPKKKYTKAHQRYKTADGTVVPGVTTILGMWGEGQYSLMAWCRKEALAGNDPNLISAEAATIGTITHEMVAGKILGYEPDLTNYAPNHLQKARNGFDGFIMWNKDYTINYTDVERYVVSEKYRFGGALDLLGTRDGKTILLDLKTGNGVYKTHKAQVSAYKHAYEEMTGIKIDECHILNTNRETGAFTHYSLSENDIEVGWQVFEHCLGLYKLNKQF